MLRQIRRGVFETNSSSVHSLTIVNKETFEKFKSGELKMTWSKEFIDKSHPDFEDEDIIEYDNLGYGDYETFEKTHVTEGGETIVAFGYYGHD